MGGFGHCVRMVGLAAGMMLACVPTALARNVALVIGNSRYDVRPLDNPTNDAQAIDKVLKSGLEFDLVTLKLNLRRDEMVRALQEFEREARGADIAIVFFAGHGAEFAGVNYLIPTDAKLEREADLEDEAISLISVTRRVAGAKKLSLVILDACRNPPFKLAGPKRDSARGLAPIEPSGSTLVAYATKDGSTADDGRGPNSPFTTALLVHLATPGIDVSFVFRAVRDDVMKATGQKQQPFLYGTLGRDPIMLKAAPAPAAPLLTTKPPTAVATPALAPAGSSAATGPAAVASALPPDEPPVHDCDRLAAYPYDRRNLVPPVAGDALDGDKAAAACQAALRAHPGASRFELQLARALSVNKLYGESRAAYERAAAGGEFRAMAALASIYASDAFGVTHDYAVSRRWAEKSAALGDLDGMFGLGRLDINGHGAPKNLTSARDWFEKAAVGMCGRWRRSATFSGWARASSPTRSRPAAGTKSRRPAVSPTRWRNLETSICGAQPVLRPIRELPSPGTRRRRRLEMPRACGVSPTPTTAAPALPRTIPSPAPGSKRRRRGVTPVRC